MSDIANDDSSPLVAISKPSLDAVSAATPISSSTFGRMEPVSQATAEVAAAAVTVNGTEPDLGEARAAPVSTPTSSHATTVATSSAIPLAAPASVTAATTTSSSVATATGSAAAIAAATNTSASASASASASGTRTGSQAVFIHKLYNMLEDESLNHLIWWCENQNSSDSFMLIPSPDFSKALSIYFKHSNIASFVRQLNMYGFHKVNDSTEAPATSSAPTSQQVASPASSSSQQQQQQPEVTTAWEFKHHSGYFKKGDAENLKNIKRRSSKNIAREINVKQIQNYLPKNYEEEDAYHDNADLLQKLNDLSHNFNLIKNDHLTLSKKYDMALEDLKKTNYDIIYLLDLIKDISANNSKDLDLLLNKFKSNILHRSSLRENDLSTLSYYHHANTSLNPTSVPALMNQKARLDSLDSVSREPIFINKDIRYSSVSSSSRRHQSILYDPLTTDPFQSRHNSNPELIRPPQQQQQQQHLQRSYSPVSPSQPPPPPSAQQQAAQQQQHLTSTPSHPHYFQDHHALPHQQPEHHLLHLRDQALAQQQQQQHISNASLTTLSSASIPISKPSASAAAPQATTQGHNAHNHSSPYSSLTRDNSIDSSSVASHSHLLPPQAHLQLHQQSQPALGMSKLQPAFENTEAMLRRGRSDSVSDRVLFKRSKN